MGKTESRRIERERAFQVLYGLSFLPAQDIRALTLAFTQSPAAKDAGMPPTEAPASIPHRPLHPHVEQLLRIIADRPKRPDSNASGIDDVIVRGLRAGVPITFELLEKYRSAVVQHISFLNERLEQQGNPCEIRMSRDQPLTIVNRVTGAPMEQDAPQPKDVPKGFAWDLTHGVWTRQGELDGIITKLSQNWRIERIAKIELTILRLALFEILHRPDVPVKVAINEAIELAKHFGDENSRSFVNGILDAAAKALEHGEIGIH